MLTPDQLLLACELVVKAVELQKATSDPVLQEILAHVISKLNGLIWS